MNYQSELERAKVHLESLGYNVAYIAIYGSQNYGLDIYTPEYQSDIDYKAIILPSLADLVKNSKPVSTVLTFEGGQIDIKDIRSYMESVVKCNVNFLEILLTEYYIGDLPMREYVIPLMREMGAFFIKASYGMMLEKREALQHPYPSTAHKVEKYGYDPKQLHHIIRLRILIERYISGDVGNFLHTGEEAEYLKSIKLGILNVDDAVKLAESEIQKVKSLRDTYTIESIFTTKEKMIQLSHNYIYSKICEQIRKDESSSI